MSRLDLKREALAKDLDSPYMYDLGIQNFLNLEPLATATKPSFFSI